MRHLQHREAPGPDQLGSSHIDFLHSLEGPTWFTLPGRDTHRNRAIVTLLHGNEPSGLKAIFELLQRGDIPATNLGILIASVSAAQTRPIFSHRYLPGSLDLNRCFSKDDPPGHSSDHQLAREIMTTLHGFEPEAVIDVHNTSAHSVPFAIATRDAQETMNLAGHLSNRLVILDLQLGTLIEQASDNMPVVTIEVGGFSDPRADQLAAAGINAFTISDDLLNREHRTLEILRHPHRLIVGEQTRLQYSASVDESAHITLFNTIDQLNFRTLPKGHAIGWAEPTAINELQLASASGGDSIDDYFASDDGLLVTRRPVTIFLATTDAVIAKRDCLLYLVPA